MYDGMFIVGIDTPEGQATYHYDIDPYWDMFHVKELELAPEWDGHTSGEAIRRIGTLTQPNEPLTLDELRGMDGEPVWVDDKKTWALLQVWDDENIDAVFPMPRGCFHAERVIGRKIYRRPPEEEEET